MTISVGKISGVEEFSLKRFFDKRGAVFRVMRSDDDFYDEFGEVYCSYVKPKAVKAWHLHKEMVLNYAVPTGTILLVLFDTRKDSPTRFTKQTFQIGVACSHSLIRIPPGIWNGFCSISKTRGALVVNVASMPHSPEEIVRKPPDKLKYKDELVHDWGEYDYGW
jgi:dTDP-4-dehydrorhamnose 3,5-epimerase